MGLVLTDFQGELPGVANYDLPNNAASEAIDCEFGGTVRAARFSPKEKPTAFGWPVRVYDNFLTASKPYGLLVSPLVNDALKRVYWHDEHTGKIMRANGGNTLNPEVLTSPSADDIGLTMSVYSSSTPKDPYSVVADKGSISVSPGNDEANMFAFGLAYFVQGSDGLFYFSAPRMFTVSGATDWILTAKMAESWSTDLLNTREKLISVGWNANLAKLTQIGLFVNTSENKWRLIIDTSAFGTSTGALQFSVDMGKVFTRLGIDFVMERHAPDFQMPAPLTDITMSPPSTKSDTGTSGSTGVLPDYIVSTGVNNTVTLSIGTAFYGSMNGSVYLSRYTTHTITGNASGKLEITIPDNLHSIISDMRSRLQSVGISSSQAKAFDYGIFIAVAGSDFRLIFSGNQHDGATNTYSFPISDIVTAYQGSSFVFDPSKIVDYDAPPSLKGVRVIQPLVPQSTTVNTQTPAAANSLLDPVIGYRVFGFAAFVRYEHYYLFTPILSLDVQGPVNGVFRFTLEGWRNTLKEVQDACPDYRADDIKLGLFANASDGGAMFLLTSTEYFVTDTPDTVNLKIDLASTPLDTSVRYMPDVQYAMRSVNGESVIPNIRVSGISLTDDRSDTADTGEVDASGSLVPLITNVNETSASSSGSYGETPITRSYIFTVSRVFEDANGNVIAMEEGAPTGTPIIVEDIYDGSIVTIKFNKPIPPGYLATVYRASAGSYLRVSDTREAKDLAIDDEKTTWYDGVPDSALGEECPSMTWISPPVVSGLVSTGFGYFIGWKNNNIYASEVYLPHAWPAEYSYAIRYNILNCINTYAGVFVMSEHGNYFISGQSPSGISVVELPTIYPCVIPSSAVSFGDSVVYITASGIAMVNTSQSVLVSEGIIDLSFWADFFGSVTACYRCAEWYVMVSTRGTYVFDIRNKTFCERTNLPEAAQFDQSTGELVVSLGVNNFKMIKPSERSSSYKWASKYFQFNAPVGFGWTQTIASGYPVNVTFELYKSSDHISAAEIIVYKFTDHKPKRFPSGNWYKIRAVIESVNPVSKVVLTNNRSELEYVG